MTVTTLIALIVLVVDIYLLKVKGHLLEDPNGIIGNLWAATIFLSGIYVGYVCIWGLVNF